jgi:hypothetical protein
VCLGCRVPLRDTVCRKRGQHVRFVKTVILAVKWDGAPGEVNKNHQNVGPQKSGLKSRL